MKTKMNGCGAIYCRYNIRGKCECDFIILGEHGECLINEPDADKIERRQALEAKLTETDESASTPNIIGFREE